MAKKVWKVSAQKRDSCDDPPLIKERIRDSVADIIHHTRNGKHTKNYRTMGFYGGLMGFNGGLIRFFGV